MAACYNLFQLPFAQGPTFPCLRPSNLPTSSRRSSPLCSASLPLWPPAVAAAWPIESGLAAVEPALRHANVLFFRSGYNVQIVVDENEPEEALVRRFRWAVAKAGVIQECKRRRFFENQQEERKRKAREAGRRNRRRRSGPRLLSSSSSSSAAAADGLAASEKMVDNLDDNWDLPEGDLPY